MTEQEHIDDLRLAAIAEHHAPLTKAEIRHLAVCPACREVVGALAEALPPPPTEAPTPLWQRWLRPAPLATFAAAAVAVLVMVRPLPDEGIRSKGDGVRMGRPSVTVLVRAETKWKVAEDAMAVPLGARLGFRYGNPDGAAKTLTILGWDGRRVHWFYPERAGEAALSMRRGPDAVALRLPFDVELDDDFDAGPLRIVVAFDAQPERLARALEAGNAKPDATLELTVVPR